MTPLLKSLLLEMAQHEMTEDERDTQVRSFAYGNTHLHNPTITRADVDRAVDTLRSKGVE